MKSDFSLTKQLLFVI